MNDYSGTEYMVVIVDSDKTHETKTKQFFRESGFISVIVAHTEKFQKHLYKFVFF